MIAARPSLAPAGAGVNWPESCSSASLSVSEVVGLGDASSKRWANASEKSPRAGVAYGDGVEKPDECGFGDQALRLVVTGGATLSR